MKFILILFHFCIVCNLLAQSFSQKDTADKANKIANHLVDLQQLGTSEGYKKCLIEIQDYKSWVKQKKVEGLQDSIYKLKLASGYLTEAFVYEALNKPGDLEKALIALDTFKTLIPIEMIKDDYNKLNYHMLRTKIFEKTEKYTEALASVEQEYEIGKSFSGTKQQTLKALALLHGIDIRLKIKPLELQKIQSEFVTIEFFLQKIKSDTIMYGFLIPEYTNVRLRYCRITEDFNYFLQHKEQFLKVLTNKSDILYFYEIWYQAEKKNLPNWLKTFLDIKKEVFDEKSINDLNTIRTQLEVAQKEVALQSANQEKQTAQNRNIIALIIIVLASISGIWIFTMFRKQKQLNQILFEQKAEIEKQKNEILQSEQDKILLLRELHHRVKNNLQMLSSMFRLQLNRLDDEKAIDALKQGQNRINALSLLHQDLYQHDNITDVDFEKYCKELAENIIFSFQIAEFQLQTNIKVPILHVESAIPIGLILSELLTNSCKHQKGNLLKLTISASMNASDMLFEYQDCSSHLDSTDSLEKSESFGIKLIKMLTLQLKGDLQIECKNGLSFKFCFKKVKYGKS